jgi:hypothetical protein
MTEQTPTGDPREMFRDLPFPFDDGRFPFQLGAVVQRTVADGEEPAREVIHAEDNSWLVGDGINDPNLPGAATVLHMHHVLQADPTLGAMASLPLGHVAKREAPGRPWVISVLKWFDEP